MTIRFILFCSLMTAFFTNAQAQVLDEETGFVYVKAEYLYETSRYEEAIIQYNQIVAKDPTFKDALVHRGMAKYALAAYKGAKMDALQSIEYKGITAEAAALLGRSFAVMNNAEAAISSLTAAIALDDTKPNYYEWRAGLYEDDDEMLKACQDYEAAANLGSMSSEMKAKNLCGYNKTKTKPSTTTMPSNQGNEVVTQAQPHGQEANTTETNEAPTNTDPDQINEDEVLSSGTRLDDEVQNPSNNQETQESTDGTTIDDSEPMMDENLPKNDHFVNSFVIDEDLTIEISGQELGRRKINETPSILILADEDGKVTINICVNKEGTVTKAEFNASMSSIAKKSLVSLALRKAKEFEFAKGKYDLQCGMMVFNIKGS